MKKLKNTISALLSLCLLIGVTACQDVQPVDHSSSNSTPSSISDLTQSQEDETRRDETQEEETQEPSLTKKYWDNRVIPQYAGTYDIMERAGGSLVVAFIKEIPAGEVYDVRLELKTDSLRTIDDGRLELGYLCVQNDKIKRATKNQATIEGVQRGIFPQDAEIIYQNTPLPDPLPDTEKGEHRSITVDGDMVTFVFFVNRVDTGYYERWVWRKGVGLISYRSGFGARRDEIFLEYTSETSAPITGRQPIMPLALPNSTGVWPSYSD